MKKWICQICGYIIENEKTRTCCVCNTPCEKFKEFDLNQDYMVNSDKNIGKSKELDDNIICDLRSIFSKECLEVGMYLAMSKVAYKEGYKKVGQIYKKIAYEEANHASILAVFLEEVVKPWTEENLKSIIDNEYKAIQSKLKLAKKAKEMGIDTIYNILNEMYKDEVRHGKEFLILLNKYFV